ncbi:hypothetical protein Dda_0202 [Drechslerella dactyloides]|uniref:AAA+ ATPase domain-containing protein n=1 Tax=Drechslerella dactyloides TaxID=74499 RepID=A0AAD6J7M2_DREDA|nr:hypothetical protein Dda_0202 [Drechslerella dactyloides]
MSAEPETEKPASTSGDEAFEEVRKDEAIKNEVKFLESRYGQDGYQNLYEVGSAPPKQDKVDKYSNFTFLSTVYFNENGLPYQRTIDIQSKPVKDLLKGMITDYPGISFSTAQVVLNFPLRVLWYYQNELKEARQKAREEDSDSELGQHLDTLIKFLDDEFESTNEEFKNLTTEGLISFELLWALFKPGELIYTTMLMQPRVLRLKSYQRTECGASLKGTFVDYDGTKFGEADAEVDIFGFTGSKKIQDLSVIPLHRIATKDSIVKRLVERGTKFVELQGCHCKKYNGVAVEMSMFGPSKVPVNGRVMIDASTHAAFNPNSAKRLRELTKPKNKAGNNNNDEYYEDPYAYDNSYGSRNRNRGGHMPATDFEDSPHAGKPTLELNDDQKLICNAAVWGYTLGSKKWLQFFVDGIEEVVWNTDSFSKLVLPEETKELICGLVESHITNHSHFDDFVEGKGKGLISVLHGAPGLGKTMTAETVAEYTRSPLYTVSAGSLGTDAVSVEKNLDRILQLCTIWKAVLLLDEADVYLEQRSLHDIQRNALVSIFLRLLEYYHGILFLTSNRVETFDEAIQSRIHIAIRYNDLTPDARAQVWKNFIAKIEGSGTKTSIVETDFDELAPLMLNGRQIKNATRTALGIADRRGETLGLKHLKMVLGVVDAFEKDMVAGKKSERVQ